MTHRRAMRGQPVLVLGLLLGGWVVLRAAYWEVPFADRPRGLPGGSPAEASLAAPVILRPPAAAPTVAVFAANRLPAPLPTLEIAGLKAGPPGPQPAVQAPIPFRLAAEGLPQSAPYQPLGGLAGMAGASRQSGHWSADFWVLLRRDTTTALTSGRGSYGRSQAGAVLRYALAPSSAFRPQVYARVSQAIGAQDSEGAFGLSVRPVPALPLRAAAEVRVAQSAAQTLLRPAAYMVTELPPVALPLGFAAEAYAQAGYVGGAYASAFADGQARVERPLVRRGPARFDLGVGAWGGAQKGAARIDVGPCASVRVSLGKASARVSADWRFRIAGGAEPASGPALTISAGF